MSPDQINEKHGKASWRCNSCGATSGLKWWHGLSVAVCAGNERCSKAEGERYANSAAEQEAQVAYEAEWIGGKV